MSRRLIAVPVVVGAALALAGCAALSPITAYPPGDGVCTGTAENPTITFGVTMVTARVDAEIIGVELAGADNLEVVGWNVARPVGTLIGTAKRLRRHRPRTLDRGGA